VLPDDHPTNLDILLMLTPTDVICEYGEDERIAHPIIRHCALFGLTLGSTHEALPVGVVNFTAYYTFYNYSTPVGSQ
jgi:hypothetical protein